jgi:hypothetical protein
MRHAEETGEPVLIAAAMWDIGNAMLHSDMPDMALDLAMRGAERLEPLLPDATPDVFTVYGHLLLLASLASVRVGDAKRGRQLLRGPANEAATKVGDDTQHHGVVFGPTNVAMYTVAVEAEAGETSEALRLADGVDIATIPSLERRTTHLYQVARCHERRGNDTAVLVHLQMAHKQCPEDFKYKRAARTMVNTLIRRARPSYAPEVRAFATTPGLLDR